MPPSPAPAVPTTPPRDLPRPAPCPDDTFVKERTYELLSSRIGDKEHVSASLGLYMRRIHLAKMLALYEAFKLVSDMPGSIVELGVFKGESLLLFGKLMEIFNANDRSTTVIGFDNFSGFTPLHAEDGAVDARVDKRPGGWSPASYRDDLLGLINVFDHDRMAGQKARIELVEGDIQTSVPAFAEANPGLRIRLLNIDCDMYEPTLVALEHLYPRVIPGGVVLLDEYAFRQFPGETAAVDKYFGDRMPRLKKFGFYSNPGAYFVKP